jgi:hypothetical protein
MPAVKGEHGFRERLRPAPVGRSLRYSLPAARRNVVAADAGVNFGLERAFDLGQCAGTNITQLNLRITNGEYSLREQTRRQVSPFQAAQKRGQMLQSS